MINPNNPSQDNFLARFRIVWSQKQFATIVHVSPYFQAVIYQNVVGSGTFILMLSGLAGKTTGRRILEYAAYNQNVFS